jgi:hypothetical protein
MNNVFNLVRKSGVPALAYPASDVSHPWSCTLRMLYAEQGALFTVSLYSDVSIQGVDEKQPVALRFEGHNLVPGKGSLGPANIVLTDAMISRLARQGGNQVYVLSLVLKTLARSGLERPASTIFPASYQPWPGQPRCASFSTAAGLGRT